MIKVIPLKNGTMFKRVFSDPAVFTAFAEDVIGIKLNITTVETEYRYPTPIGFVNTTYDLFAEDESQRIIVEIQHVKEEDFFDRFLYYHLISLAEQVTNYADYSYTRAVYTIVVLTSVPRDKSVWFSYAVSDMSPVDEFGKRVAVYPHRLIFLNPRNVNDQTPTAVKAWLDLIDDSLDSQVDAAQYPRPLFQDMIQRMRDSAIDPEVLSEIKDDAAWDRAKDRFRQEGALEAQAELVRNMHANGLDVAQISQLIGLSVEDVTRLLRQ